ncbi:hypothetical protein, partial [Bacillus cereus]|uniref:hypothetical protein n=1 Tax=Bacillus cereus TaxID=1396 RepID=UPI0034D5B7E6
ERNRHLHFPSNDLLNNDKSLMPRPPTSLGLQTDFQLTQAIFLVSRPPPDKKSLMMLLQMFSTLLGNLKKER